MSLRFSASSAGRLTACPASANLEKAIPGWQPPVEDPNKYQAKGIGTAIHDILYELVQNVSVIMSPHISGMLKEYALLHHTKRAKISESEHTVDKFIIKHLPVHPYIPLDSDAIVYVRQLLLHTIPDLKLPPRTINFIVSAFEDVLHLIASGWGKPLELMLEKKMATDWIGSPGGSTTVDAAILVRTPTGVKLHVIDYKTGSVPVEAYNNDQLLFYAISVMELIMEPVLEVELHIMQPKNFNTWLLTYDQLEVHKRRLIAANQRIMEGDLTFGPSDHCVFCPANPYARGEKAAPYCPAQMELLFPPQVDLDEILS